MVSLFHPHFQRLQSMKYVDDQTQGEVVQLNSALNIKADQNGRRLYHDRHGHVLQGEKSLLQERLIKIEENTKIHQLKLNETKWFSGPKPLP